MQNSPATTIHFRFCCRTLSPLIVTLWNDTNSPGTNGQVHQQSKCYCRSLLLSALSPSKAWTDFRVLTAKLGCRSNKKPTEQPCKSLYRVLSVEPGSSWGDNSAPADTQNWPCLFWWESWSKGNVIQVCRFAQHPCRSKHFLRQGKRPVKTLSSYRVSLWYVSTTQSDFHTERTWQELCMGDRACQRGINRMLKGPRPCRLAQHVSKICLCAAKEARSATCPLNRFNTWQKDKDPFKTVMTAYYVVVLFASAAPLYVTTEWLFQPGSLEGASVLLPAPKSWNISHLPREWLIFFLLL